MRPATAAGLAAVTGCCRGAPPQGVRGVEQAAVGWETGGRAAAAAAAAGATGTCRGDSGSSGGDAPPRQQPLPLVPLPPHLQPFPPVAATIGAAVSAPPWRRWRPPRRCCRQQCRRRRRRGGHGWQPWRWPRRRRQRGAKGAPAITPGGEHRGVAAQGEGSVVHQLINYFRFFVSPNASGDRLIFGGPGDPPQRHNPARSRSPQAN